VSIEVGRRLCCKHSGRLRHDHKADSKRVQAHSGATERILVWLLVSFYIVAQLIALTDSPGKTKPVTQLLKIFPLLLVTHNLSSNKFLV
jgi:hypothetical protein